ncbi:hypothetical protein [Pedobacter cryoconitis]|uniref:Endosialidase-like protein n=1 Tax=Pedobacter cryoconitis TaxID=188932 RepID=A0A7X0J4H1_9SPHI|nr:hypothetical protein [Pedobacter cryoconitis]MBB6499647.1 hypothetical protein [Pedobacter cryoconitis]
MKNLFLIITFTGYSVLAQTQPTNCLPQNGSVGIGTLNPNAKLEINATSGITPLRAVGSNGALLIDNVGSGESYYQANMFHQFQGTSSAPILTMLNTGNVGIGTVTPVSKLDLSGILHIAYPGILNYSSTGGTYIGWNKSGGGGEANFVNNIAGGNMGGFTFDKTTDGSTFTRLMTIADNGNVGIGTITPVSKLDLSGILHIAYPGILNYSSTGGTYIGWNKSGGGGEANFVNNIAGGNTGGFAFDKTTDGSTFTRLMTISDNGNVGIGTNTPDAKLAVNGTIHSREVKVNTQGWPDYVFKSNYVLPSLAEIKTYINENHHLPEMPTEQEVAKEGIKLGELNKLLVKKIEELTLYLIQQKEDADKQNKILQQQINELKKRDPGSKNN